METKIINLILENNFEKLKETLKGLNSELKIYNILLQILNDHKLNENDYGFEANIYQEDFLEGLACYKAFKVSTISKTQLEEIKSSLVFLVFKMGGFIKILADTSMRKGVYLSQIESAYKVNPDLRDQLQSFIELLKQENDTKAIANTAAAKAQISLSIGNLLRKAEVGQDMLQFAVSYENAGLKDQATQLYKNIMNDFECESVKESTGLFPEITHVDTRTSEEVEIFETARKRYQIITGESVSEPKRIHKDEDINAKKLVEKVDKYVEQTNEKNDNRESSSFFGKFRKFFN